MRTRFRHDLDELAAHLRTICQLDRTAIALATRALLETELAPAQRAIQICARITALRENSEHAAVRLLALQAPVAGDLRQVVSALHLITDLTRMGAQAKHIALTARRRHPACVVPEAVRPGVAHMGAIAIAMATDAAAALDSHDPEEATRLHGHAQIMDELCRTMRETVLAPGWSDGITAAVDLTILAACYERFADHAVQVGHRTIPRAAGLQAQPHPASIRRLFTE